MSLVFGYQLEEKKNQQITHKKTSYQESKVIHE